MATAKGRPGAVTRAEELADPKTQAPNTTDRYSAAAALAKSLEVPDYGSPVPGGGAGVTAGEQITGGPMPQQAPERTSSRAGVTAGNVLTRGGVTGVARGSAAGVKGHQTGSARGVATASNRMKRIGSS